MTITLGLWIFPAVVTAVFFGLVVLRYVARGDRKCLIHDAVLATFFSACAWGGYFLGMEMQ